MSLTTIKLQEPVIDLRAYFHDLPRPSAESLYKYYAIWDALTVLSLYKPITPHMTLGLNVIRALPSFKTTFNEICRGQFNPSQMMKTAYYAAVIGLTVLNPVYGMLAANTESIYLATSFLYKNFRTIAKVQVAITSLGIFGHLSQFSLFFTSNPINIYLTTIPFVVGSVISIINRVANTTQNANRKTYLDIADFLLRSAVLYYKHKLALNSISLSNSI